MRAMAGPGPAAPAAWRSCVRAERPDAARRAAAEHAAVRSMSATPEAVPRASGALGLRADPRVRRGLHHLEPRLGHAEEGLTRGAAAGWAPRARGAGRGRPPRAPRWCRRGRGHHHQVVERRRAVRDGRTRRGQAIVREGGGRLVQVRAGGAAHRPAGDTPDRAVTLQAQADRAHLGEIPLHPEAGAAQAAGGSAIVTSSTVGCAPGSATSRTLERLGVRQQRVAIDCRAMGAIVARAPLRVALGEVERTCLLLPEARRLVRLDRHRPLRAHDGVAGLPAAVPPEESGVGGDGRPPRGAPPDPPRGAGPPLGRAAGGAGLGVGRAPGHRLRVLQHLRGLCDPGAPRRGGEPGAGGGAGRGGLRDRDRRARPDGGQAGPVRGRVRRPAAVHINSDDTVEARELWVPGRGAARRSARTPPLLHRAQPLGLGRALRPGVGHGVR